MLKIAHCDDMEQDRNNILFALSQIEEKWNEKFDIKSFSSGEDLCADIEKNHYDIILLDILMNGIDGVETAIRIRNNGDESLIIFISSYDERVKELFDFGTIAFIDKPVDINQLEKALIKANDIIKKKNDIFFSYEKNGVTQHLPINDIVYFESKRNKIYIQTNKNMESFYGTVTSVWQLLKGNRQFIMPHRSFIFNLKYVIIKSDKVIIRSSGEEYNIGLKYKENTQERYLDYIEKRF